MARTSQDTREALRSTSEDTNPRVMVRRRGGRPTVFFIIAFFLVVTSLKSTDSSSGSKGSVENGEVRTASQHLGEREHHGSSILKSSNLGKEKEGGKTEDESKVSEIPEEPTLENDKEESEATTSEKSTRRHTTTEDTSAEETTTESFQTTAKPANESTTSNETEGKNISSSFTQHNWLIY